MPAGSLAFTEIRVVRGVIRSGRPLGPAVGEGTALRVHSIERLERCGAVAVPLVPAAHRRRRFGGCGKCAKN